MFKRVQLVFLETSKGNKMAALWLAKWSISSCPKRYPDIGPRCKINHTSEMCCYGRLWFEVDMLEYVGK